MTELKFSVILAEPDDEGWIVVTVPLLPGCVSQGKTQKEALENIREAIEGYVEVLREDGEAIPQELSWAEVKLSA